MFRKEGLLVILLIATYVSRAQTVTRFHIHPRQPVVEQQAPVTAIVIKADSFHGNWVTIFLNEEELMIPLDPDAPDFSYFISLPKAISPAKIQTPSDAEYQLYLINSGSAPSSNKTEQRMDQEDCSFSFHAVPQSEWRDGLAPPAYERVFTKVEHVVVHHSAGSNLNTNYTRVVRDIYVYHTEVNGWSDIGYNYLIAQDGTIYTGRDPGNEGSQENVMGAHFCGSNSTTMGVCLLGNYESAYPTPGAWSSLQNVIAYKLAKEDLHPYETNNHPLGELGTIVGHRDGCSTLCPGDHVYVRLDELRSSINALLDGCKDEREAILEFSISDASPLPGEETIVTNTSTGYDHFKWIFEGAIPDTAYWIQNGTVKYVLPGSYNITLIGYRASTSDTLIRNDAVLVEAEPVIYPNPVTGGGTIHIAANETQMNVKLHGIAGKEYKLEENGPHSYQIPYLSGGVYFLRFENSGKRYSRKILVK